MKEMPKFAVILSGCGRADGSEIHEATVALLAIDKAGCTYQCFAPNIEQNMVINHLTSEKMEEKRNVLIESSRIARGDIKPLNELNLDEYDCLVFPGGLGAVTNWCDFALKGINCTVESSISNLLNQAYDKKKVIGAMCIAPVVIAKVLGKHKIGVTIGNDKTVAENIEKTGAIHHETKATEAYADSYHKIVTTPAYMLAKSIKEVAGGAESMVQEMIKLSQ